MHCDATKEALPRRTATGTVAEERTPHGVRVTTAGLKACTGELGPPRRHGCIVVRVSALDTNAAIGVVARRQTVPGACGYSLIITPYYRTVHLTRYAATTKVSNTTALHEFEFHTAVAPVGQPNEIELRCADSIFQIFVNGHQIGTCLDAALGFGGFGWRVESNTKDAARAMIHATTLFAVS
jgi:hypothetical protein